MSQLVYETIQSRNFWSLCSSAEDEVRPWCVLDRHSTTKLGVLSSSKRGLVLSVLLLSAVLFCFQDSVSRTILYSPR